MLSEKSTENIVHTLVQNSDKKKNALSQIYFIFLSIFLLAGFFIGVFFACKADIGLDNSFFPLKFSGIPIIGTGFFASFSSFLLNAIIGLICLFLAGLTAFGVLAVPAIILFKGFSIGIASVLFLVSTPNGIVQSAFTYMPAMALFSIMFLFFAVRSFSFSKSFSGAVFSNENVKAPDFTAYLRDFFLFLFFSVIISASGSIFTIIYPLFFK